jgi:hypothetical protein
VQPIQGNKLQIALFEGMASEVTHATNGWLAGSGRMVEVVDIGFNYQGPEYDGKKKLTDNGTHGVLIVYRDLPINEACEMEDKL